MSDGQVTTLALRPSSPSSSSESVLGASASSVEDISALPVKKKRARAGNPKARTGCITCKIRHVKCDETKPECDRCTSTGRKCDGYYIPPRKKREPRAIVLHNPSDAPDVTAAEVMALDFFHHKTAPALASYFDANFWTRLVFQMSYVEPCVRHAMTAVASLHMMRDRSSRKVPIDWPILVRGPMRPAMPFATYSNNVEDRFAISQYNRAISHLSSRMDNSSAAIRVTLLACILFVCVEFLRGDAESSHRHFQSGMKLAISLIDAKNEPTLLHTMEDFQTSMLPIFNRLELLSMLMGYDVPSWAYPVELVSALPQHFLTMKEARDSLVHLANLSIRLIRDVRGRRRKRTVTSYDHETRDLLVAQLKLWEAKMNHMIAGDNVTPRELEGAKVLRLHKYCSVNWLSKLFYELEVATDEFMDDYAEAVTLAESIQDASELQDQPIALESSSFLFDMEIVSPLYYLAKSCGHPLIRRRAVALLKKTYRREGLWDSQKAAAIAERVIQIEEANMTVLDGSETAPLRDRIWRTTSTSEIGVRAKRIRVVFYSKPDGFEGKWKVWAEDLIIP